AEPIAYRLHGLAQTRKRRLRRIQTPEPAAQRGRVGHAIGIFDRGRRSFPTPVLQKVAPQCLAAGYQAVVAVRGRKQRQEGECLPAQVTNATPNPDPIMMLVMCLFAATAMTDDGVLQTDRASAQDDFRIRLG